MTLPLHYFSNEDWIVRQSAAGSQTCGSEVFNLNPRILEIAKNDCFFL